MADDFSLCMVTNSRMAARAVTRRYDAHVRPFGISATQFSLLGAIKTFPDSTVSELAERRGFERTTLTRNLDRLQQLGLIASHAPERGNGRICAVTDKGEALIRELLPLWRGAQAEMRSELGADGFEHTIATLRRLATV